MVYELSWVIKQQEPARFADAVLARRSEQAAKFPGRKPAKRGGVSSRSQILTSDEFGKELQEMEDKKKDAEDRKLQREKKKQKAEEKEMSASAKQPKAKRSKKATAVSTDSESNGSDGKDLDAPWHNDNLASDSEELQKKTQKYDHAQLTADMQKIKSEIDDDKKMCFYAVFFDRGFYWGQVQAVLSDDPDDDANKVEFKFLERRVGIDAKTWRWPLSEDKEIVDINRVFLGPAPALNIEQPRIITFRFSKEPEAARCWGILKKMGSPVVMCAGAPERAIRSGALELRNSVAGNFFYL